MHPCAQHHCIEAASMQGRTRRASPPPARGGCDLRNPRRGGGRHARQAVEQPRPPIAPRVPASSCKSREAPSLFRPMSARRSDSRGRSRGSKPKPREDAAAASQAAGPAPVTFPAPRRGNAKLTAMVVAALLAVYATLALAAAHSKSPTYDEPLHALSG